MAVARTHHNKNYTCMSNYHFQDKSLSLKAKGLLSLMLSLPDTWDYSVAGLASLSKDGETSVRTAVKELEESNYLIRTPIRENGKIVDWEYDIFEKPREILEVENQQVESQLLENKDNKVYKQLNTKKENTKNNSKELLQNVDFQFGKKKKAKKDNLYAKCVSLIDSYDFANWSTIRNLLIDYLNFRISVKDKPLYINMWKGMLNKLCELADNDITIYESIIKQSIERGYLSFYPVREFTNTQKPWEEGVRSSRYTDEELEELERLTKEREAKGMRTKF